MYQKPPGALLHHVRTMSAVVDQHAPLEPPTGTVLWEEVARAFERWRDQGASADPLVHLMTPVLWHVARACRLPEDLARDVVQDVWLALVRRRDEIETPRAVASWLITATRRDAWRARQRADRATATTLAPPEEGGLETLLPPSGTAEEEAIGREEATRLWRAVATLPERCQRLLRVIAFSDRPDYQSLSADLGMPVGSIGPTRARCLGKLRAALTDPAGTTGHADSQGSTP